MHDLTVTLSHSGYNLFWSDLVEGLSRLQKTIPCRWLYDERGSDLFEEITRLEDYYPTPHPAKIALLLEEAGLPYEAIPVDTSKGEQHAPSFRTINPNGKVPAIVDTEGPGACETRFFDSTAILIYLAEKTGKFLGAPEDRSCSPGSCSSPSGLGPFSGQAVHFQFVAPEGLDYAVDRYRRKAERHYQVLNEHLRGPERSAKTIPSSR